MVGDRTDLLAHTLAVIEEEGLKLENAALVRQREQILRLKKQAQHLRLGLYALAALVLVQFVWLATR